MSIGKFVSSGNGEVIGELRLMTVEGKEGSVFVVWVDGNDSRNVMSLSAGLDGWGLLSMSVKENSELCWELSMDGAERKRPALSRRGARVR